jgi:hypothetical protein
MGDLTDRVLDETDQVPPLTSRPSTVTVCS